MARFGEDECVCPSRTCLNHMFFLEAIYFTHREVTPLISQPQAAVLAVCVCVYVCVDVSMLVTFLSLSLSYSHSRCVCVCVFVCVYIHTLAHMSRPALLPSPHMYATPHKTHPPPHPSSSRAVCVCVCVYMCVSKYQKINHRRKKR